MVVVDARMANFFKKIINAVRDCAENSEVCAPPRKIFVWRVFDLNISLANVLNFFISAIVIILTCLTEYGIIPSKKVGFYCKDPLISHKYTGDTVTPEILGVTAILVPVTMILTTEMLIHQSFKRINIFTAYLLFRDCLVGTITVLFLTSMAKVLLGEHRPHFFDVCEPDTAMNCTEGTFVESFTCTSTKYDFYVIADSSLSFPSGHASTTWFIGMFSSYIVHERLPTINAGTLMKPFLILVCLTWSLVCSLTRITDRRHHWWDVLAGTTIGILASLYSITVVHQKLSKMDLSFVAKHKENPMEMEFTIE
ncbi:phospholipid phosphatase 1 [Leptinotarsa decemlineata]|uniref:phospholipid phosphatase 1 n=1 Tax=Leptinotarsa decemlineata TaxID=7539 RepID=UPI003D3041BE